MKHIARDGAARRPSVKLALLAAHGRRVRRRPATAPIGMDHFALPRTSCARGRRRVLHRNFMGYTVHGRRRHGGARRLGASATCRARSSRTQEAARVLRGACGRPIPDRARLRADQDDELRRHVITELMCNFHLDVPQWSGGSASPSTSYFATSSAVLTAARVRRSRWPRLGAARSHRRDSRSGGMFVRNVCMVFDRYLRRAHRRPQAGLQPHGMTARRVVVAGGGITGLVTAFTLQQEAATAWPGARAVPARCRRRAGGHARTIDDDGWFDRTGSERLPGSRHRDDGARRRAADRVRNSSKPIRRRGAVSSCERAPCARCLSRRRR